MMASKMLIIVAALFLIQYGHSQDTQDPRVRACAKKIWEQVEQLQLGKVPVCFNTQKLKEVMKEAEVFEKFKSEVPEKCKKLTTENAGECFEIVSNLINQKSGDLKTSLLNSIKGVIDSFSDCFEVFKYRVSNLDKYVANGCED